MDEPFYDEATSRRIDGGTLKHRRRVGGRAHFAGTVTMITGIGLGLQQVFDPPVEEEIVLQLDTSGQDHDDEPVSFDYDPTSVRRSRAYVRPWLVAQLP